MKKMNNFHKKGEACPGKFELPQLLPNSVEKVLLFDAGDVIVLKDLTELYNYDMKNHWVLGLPEPW
jgi:lipopolysaccharide biosynthesis glycosyltransferase